MNENSSIRTTNGIAVAQLPLSVDEPITVRFHRDELANRSRLALRFCSIGLNRSEEGGHHFYFVGDPAIPRFTTAFNTLSIPSETWTEPPTGIRPVSAINSVMISDWLRDYDATISATDVLDDGTADYASPRLLGALVRHLLYQAGATENVHGVIICADAMAANFYLASASASPQTPHLLKLDWLSNTVLAATARTDISNDLYNVSRITSADNVAEVLPAFVPITDTKLYVSRSEALLTDALVQLHDAGGITAILPRPDGARIRKFLSENPLIAVMERVGHGAPVEWVLSLNKLRLQRDHKGDEIRVEMTPAAFLSLPFEALNSGFDPIRLFHSADRNAPQDASVRANFLEPLGLSYPGNAASPPALFFDTDGTTLDANSSDFYRRFGFTYPRTVTEILQGIDLSMERGAIAAAFVWHENDALPALHGIEKNIDVSGKLQHGSVLSDQLAAQSPQPAPAAQANASEVTVTEGNAAGQISKPHISNIDSAYASDNVSTRDDEREVREDGENRAGEFFPSIDPKAEIEDYDEALHAAILRYSSDLASCIEDGTEIQLNMLPGDIYDPEAGKILFFGGSLTDLGSLLLGELLKEEEDLDEVDFWDLWEYGGAHFAAELYTEFHLRKPFDAEGADESDDDDQNGNGDAETRSDGGEDDTHDSLAPPKVAGEQPHDTGREISNPLPGENLTLTRAGKIDTEVKNSPQDDMEHRAIGDVLDAVPGNAADQAASVIGFSLGGKAALTGQQTSVTDQRLSTSIAGILRGLGRTEIELTDEDISKWAGRMMAYADAVERGIAHNITDEDLDRQVTPKTDAGAIATLTLAGCMFMSATAKAMKAQRKRLVAGQELTLDMLRAWDWEDGLKRAADVIGPAAKDDEFDAHAVTAVVARWHSQVVERISAAEQTATVADRGHSVLAGLVVSYLLSAARDRVQATSERAFTEALAAIRLKEIPFDALPDGWETMTPDAFQSWASEDDQAGNGAGGSAYATTTRAMLWFTENVMPRIRDRFGLTDDHPVVVDLRENFVSEASEDPSLLSISITNVEGMEEEIALKLATMPAATNNRSGLNG